MSHSTALPLSTFQGIERLRENYRSSGTDQLTVPASVPTSEFSWLLPTRERVERALSEFGDKVKVYAHITNAELHLHVLTSFTQNTHEYATALAKLEVDLSKALVNNFEDVLIHDIPENGLTKNEIDTYHRDLMLFP